jgi:hypothetical protein
MNLKTICPWLALVLLAPFVGCSKAEFEVAPCEGTVSCNGTRLVSGVVYFTPMGTEGKPLAGKSGGGVVGSDGRFKVSTYAEGDGAVVGKHRVVWQAEEEHGGKAGPRCSRDAFAEVEVPAGGILDLVVDLKDPKK